MAEDFFIHKFSICRVKSASFCRQGFILRIKKACIIFKIDYNEKAFERFESVGLENPHRQSCSTTTRKKCWHSLIRADVGE